MFKVKKENILNAFELQSEITVDNFAGGGGASLGIFMATGKHPDVAINHDEAAIVMHAANHPKTRHFTEDIWKCSPRHVTQGRPVGLLWASPDCKHFSRAKGSKPVEKKIRSLAWVICKWAAEASPRVIILENVREFEDWGPLVPSWACQECDWKGTEGQALLIRKRPRCPRCEAIDLRKTDSMIPDPKRKGLTFKRFVRRFKSLGYQVEWRTCNAADFGAPTHRRRLFLIARNDEKPIVWPMPSHGDPVKIKNDDLFCTMKPWRTAAECIDWDVSCPSIFERKRPLADATMRRIALGIKRYVLDNPKPFIVTINHSGDAFRGQSGNEPMGTMTGKQRDAVVTPFIAKICQGGAHGSQIHSLEKPLSTLVSKNEHLLISPVLVGAGGPERSGRPRSADKPNGVIMPKNSQALVSAFLAKHYGGAVGCRADSPLPKTTTRGTQNQVCSAFIQPFYAKSPGQSPDKPLPVSLSKEKHSLVAANLIHLNRGDQGTDMNNPMRTAMSGGNHAALVYSFLIKYFGTSIGQPVDEPMHTQTGKDRFGLVTVNVAGEMYVIVDIGMRMLTPRELARGQGFPDSYILTGTKTSQVARIGNSVAPQVAEALVRANFKAKIERRSYANLQR